MRTIRADKPAQNSATNRPKMIAYCLADLFNLRLWPIGRAPSYPDVRDGLEELARAVVRCTPEAKDVRIRLYGGWHGDVPETRVDLREMVVRAIDRIPQRVNRSRLGFEIAETPHWDRSIRLLRSVKRVPITHIAGELQSHSSCANPATCALDVLGSWFRGRCPTSGCGVRLSDVASSIGQKMVDTLLTADAIEISSTEAADILLVASDDEDMIPALLAASRNRISVVHMVRREGSPPPYYRGILELSGVTIKEW